MESHCKHSCQSFLECECRELLCPHTTSYHLMQGHSAKLVIQLACRSYPKKTYTEICNQKAEVIHKGAYLIQKVEQLISYQLSQLVKLEAKLENFAGISPSAHSQILKELDALKYSQSKELEQLQESIGKPSSLVVSKNTENVIEVFKNNTLTQALKGHTNEVRSVAVLKNKEFLVSGSKDKTIRVWSLSTGEQIRLLKGHTGTINSIAVSSKEEFIASGGKDKIVRVWNLNTGEQSQTFEGHTSEVLSVAISNKDNFIVSGSTDKTIRVWTGQKTELLKGHNAGVLSLVVSSDDEFIVSGSKDKTIRIWSKQKTKIFRGHSDWVLSLAISNRDSFLVSESNHSIESF